MHRGEYPRCISALRRALRRTPSLAAAHGLLGELLTEAGRADDGLRRLDEAIGLDDKLLTAHLARTRTLVLSGRTAKVSVSK